MMWHNATVLLALGVIFTSGMPESARAGEAREQRGSVTQVSSRAYDFGPEVTAYLGFIRDEVDELEYQLAHDEITPDEYKLSKARLAVTRDALVRIARKRGDDLVPELHVLAASELTQIFSNGIEAVRGKRAGDRIDDTWIFHGTVNRGHTFYIFERVGLLGPGRAY